MAAAERASLELLGSVSTVRTLRDGRLLVNDISGRKLVLFERDLSSSRVIADTTSATGRAYGSRAGGLIAYGDDSSLFVDPATSSMLVIDGSGSVARVAAIPRPGDANFLIGGAYGLPGVDAAGRLVYLRRPAATNGTVRPPGEAGRDSQPAEPAMLLRVDLASRRVDTVGRLRSQSAGTTGSVDATGRRSNGLVINPLSQADDWTLLRDGSIALVRSQDYRIDWVRPDGRHETTAPLPHEWRHLSDSEKVAFLDSARASLERLRAEAGEKLAAGDAASLRALAAASGGSVTIQVDPASTVGSKPGAAAPAVLGGMAISLPPLVLVPPEDLPDYVPPFVPGSARGDMEGNLWIRTTIVVNGGSVYDIISSRGRLIDRILVPTGRVIAGFGYDGAVFMGVREGSGVRLEQSRVR